MTRNILGTSTAVGPVAQFSLLIIPLVVNGFYMVYSLTGWILDGLDKLNWALEARNVGLWVAGIMVAFCTLVIAYTLLRGGSRRHPLVMSSIGHIVVVLLLTVSLFVSVSL